jgi:hypothetical protein
MGTLDETKQLLSDKKNFVKHTYKVASLGVFGSVARNENHLDSDVDILVEFSSPVSFFTFLELEDYLAKLLGKKVDLVSKNALKTHISKQILSEVSQI